MTSRTLCGMAILVPVDGDPRLRRPCGVDPVEFEEERGGELGPGCRLRDLGPREDGADRTRTIEVDELRPCP